MQKQRNNALVETQTREPLYTPCVGVIEQIKEDGDILVTFGNNPPIAAKLVRSVKRNELVGQIGCEVLLVFDQGDPEKPIIINLMENRLEELLAFEVKPDSEQPETSKNIVVDGKQITVEADDELSLRCGKGSITLRKDGRIVLRGTHVVSSSSGVNKIKGGAVRIN